MKVRLLGAHNLETRDTRHTCFLIDDTIALDAGSLVTGLSAAELERIEALLLTHHHYDHTRDVPTVGLARRDAETPLGLYGLAETIEGTRRHLMDGEVYPDMTRELNDSPPRYTPKPVKAGVPFRVGQYDVKAIPVPHPVPAVGYLVRAGGDVFGFTGDTGGDLLPFFRDPWGPRTLFVDMTFPNRLRELAELTGHLTPGLLKEQISQAKSEGLPLPKIVAVHRGLGTEAELLRELAHVKADLSVPLLPGYQGMVI